MILRIGLIMHCNRSVCLSVLKQRAKRAETVSHFACGQTFRIEQQRVQRVGKYLSDRVEYISATCRQHLILL